MQEGGSLFPFGSQSADWGEIWGKEGFGSIFLCAVCGNGTQKTLSCALGRKADSETLRKEKECRLGNYRT